MYFLNYPRFSKYNWCNSISNNIKIVNVNYLNIIQKNNFYFRNENNFNKINNFVFFKKKSIMIKKNADYEYITLNRVNSSRDTLLLSTKNHLKKKFNDIDKNLKKKPNYNYNYIKLKKNSVFKKNKNFSNKNIDFKKKINLIFNKNRILLRKFLKVKFKRQHVFSKYIKNLTKLNQVDFLYNFEHRLLNILVKSSFFFNFQDCIWFFKNGFISVNGEVVYNFKKKLKPLQIVNIAISNYFFYYYKFMLNNCISNLYKFGSKIWKINYQRYNRIEKRETYPTWIYKHINYKEDVPKFLEIDYVTMSLVMLNYSFDKNFLDFYNIKFLNLYLNRLYNWKRII